MKKEETRFTIRFCPTDPRHQKTMQILNAAGRRKASLIADAIHEYSLRYDGTGETNTLPSSSNSESLRNTTNDQEASSETYEKKNGETKTASSDADVCQAVLNGMSVFLNG